MNKLAITILATITAGASYADFTVKIPMQENNVTFSSWVTTDPIFGEWENTGDIHSCSNWAPSNSDITVGKSFTQTATDCKQNQIRTVQDRQIDELSGSIRNIGEIYSQMQVITVSSTQEAVGSKESWVATTPTYTAWVNSGAVTGCTNWSPATSTVTTGQSFTQTATDCEQAQTRSRQDREQETTTNAIRNKGTAVTENQTITTSSTRSATGSKETWIATTPTYTAWVNSGAVTGCTNWSPATSTVTIGQSFTQTATDCKQAQTRSRQDREQETTTNAIRNKGTAVTENQTITASSTRSAVGTKSNAEVRYDESNMAYTFGTTGNYMFIWGNAYIGGGGNSITSGGYRYTASTLKKSETTCNFGACTVTHYYEITRTPL